MNKITSVGMGCMFAGSAVAIAHYLSGHQKAEELQKENTRLKIELGRCKDGIRGAYADLITAPDESKGFADTVRDNLTSKLKDERGRE